MPLRSRRRISVKQPNSRQRADLLLARTCKTAPGRLSFSRSQKRAKSEDGVPGKTRTCDPWFRKPMLYPAELRGLFRFGPLAHSENRITSGLTGLRFRKPLLYPAGLRDRLGFLVANRKPRQSASRTSAIGPMRSIGDLVFLRHLRYPK